MKVDNRTVVVTGGSSGIGLAVARELAGHGCRTVLCARDPDALARAVDTVPGSVALRTDLSTSEGREHLVSVVRDQYPDASVLVNCAGIMSDDRLAPADVDVTRHQVHVNLLAPVELTVSLLDHLARDMDGAVVNVTSGVAYVPVARTAVYSATKAALHSYTLSLRERVRDRGVRVFELIPTAVDTRMTAGLQARKISPEAAARALVAGMQSDDEEIRVGQAGSLVALSRLAPNFIFRRLNPPSSLTVAHPEPGGAVDATSWPAAPASALVRDRSHDE